MSTKLVIVEGIPGSGKTTMARYIRDSLDARGRETRLFLEGDLDHPADYESVACLTAGQYEALRTERPEWRSLLDRHVRELGGDRLVGYRKLQAELGEGMPGELFERLAAYETYELSPDRFRDLIGRSWREFGARAAVEDAVYVFECCFLQNPLTMLLGRHDEPISSAKGFVGSLAETIRPLDPLMVYLDPGEPATVLARVAEARPREWLEFVIWYHTQQGHGRAEGWQGFEGMVRFYEMRKAVELELLEQLPLRSVIVRHNGWDEDRQQVAEALASLQ